MQLLHAPQIWALLISGCGRHAAIKGGVRRLRPLDEATDPRMMKSYKSKRGM